MDTEEEEEDDDPTSSSLSPQPIEKSDKAEKSFIVSDDILFLCFEWLFAAQLSRCMVVSKHWNEAAKDNHLWKVQCAMCFRRVSSKHFANKYQNSYYSYYQRHNKLRFDGVYVLKVMYFIQSEAHMPSFNTNVHPSHSPYTTIEYYRYLRFFNNKCSIIMNNKNHKIEKIKNDQSFNALYALSKNRPSEYGLMDVFGPLHASHQNIFDKNKSSLVASFHNKVQGITTREKVFRAKYDISDKKNVKVSVKTDYGLALELGLTYYEVIAGASDRLRMEYFDGLSLNERNEVMESTRDHYEVRHEPFCFIPDIRFKVLQEYFD